MEKITKIEENLSLDERIKKTKEFFGLKPEQSFQDLEVDEEQEGK